MCFVTTPADATSAVVRSSVLNTSFSLTWSRL
jgi:hypothetical protein